jgi:group I intron endonuclease
VEDARNKEDELLKTFQNEEFVVNETASAWNQKGYKHTEDSKAKMRETRNRPEMIEASRQRMLGKPNTEEQKRKISESLKGRACPEHVKLINSEKFKGVLRTEDVKKNIKAGILENIDPVYCDGKVFASAVEAAKALNLGRTTVDYRINSPFKTEWCRITKDDPRWLAHLAEQEKQ